MTKSADDVVVARRAYFRDVHVCQSKYSSKAVGPEVWWGVEGTASRPAMSMPSVTVCAETEDGARTNISEEFKRWYSDCSVRWDEQLSVIGKLMVWSHRTRSVRREQQWTNHWSLWNATVTRRMSIVPVVPIGEVVTQPGPAASRTQTTTRIFLDCDQSNYSSRIIFPYSLFLQSCCLIPASSYRR